MKGCTSRQHVRWMVDDIQEAFQVLSVVVRKRQQWDAVILFGVHGGGRYPEHITEYVGGMRQIETMYMKELLDACTGSGCGQHDVAVVEVQRRVPSLRHALKNLHEQRQPFRIPIFESREPGNPLLSYVVVVFEPQLTLKVPEGPELNNVTTQDCMSHHVVTYLQQPCEPLE